MTALGTKQPKMFHIWVTGFGSVAAASESIWGSALANLLMMVAAKSEDLEVPPLYLDDFSKRDAQSRQLSFGEPHTTDFQQFMDNLQNRYKEITRPVTLPRQATNFDYSK